MPKSVVPANIGDISNISGVTQLTPVEKAKNDLSRLAGKFDLSGLEFTADGMPTLNTLRQFVQAMPDAERGALINAKTGSLILMLRKDCLMPSSLAPIRTKG
jgi:hypothetical protein